MIERSKVIENVKNNGVTVAKFLGFIKKDPPAIITRKIGEELEKFEDYIDMEYEYKVFEQDGEMYADILYTIGGRLETVIQNYVDNGEGIRAMIMDKIGVVILDSIKDEIEKEKMNFEKYNKIITMIKEDSTLTRQIIEEIEKNENEEVREKILKYSKRNFDMEMDFVELLK